jgi:hypothetical protein
VWHGRTWLIDHGAALYPHHGSWKIADAARRGFPAIRDHVLLPFAGSILEADARIDPDRSLIDAVVAAVPDEFLADEGEAGPDARRAQYAGYLERRLETPREFAEEAERARLAL